MDLIILEVDGSLANPYVTLTVALWTSCLSALAVVFVRRGLRLRRHLFLLGFLLFAGMLATAAAQTTIGIMLYSLTSGGLIVDVGFWGGPPSWIAPLVSTVVGVMVWAYDRRQTDL